MRDEVRRFLCFDMVIFLSILRLICFYVECGDSVGLFVASAPEIRISGVGDITGITGFPVRDLSLCQSLHMAVEEKNVGGGLAMPVSEVSILIVIAFHSVGFSGGFHGHHDAARAVGVLEIPPVGSGHAEPCGIEDVGVRKIGRKGRARILHPPGPVE